MLQRFYRRLPLVLSIATILTAFSVGRAYAQTTNEQIVYAFNNFVLFFSAVLVLFMNAGFAFVETGMNASKNTVNILFKNTITPFVGIVSYWVIGYSLMYSGATNPYFNFGGLFLNDTTPAALGLSDMAFFLFQAAFAATAATIVSGAVAGRIKFGAYLVFTVILCALIYPIAGFWTWGGGWLAQMGFHDFAGSQLVHSLGGFAALAGIIVLGPRIGRFSKDADQTPFLPSSYGYATLGVFILWIGWYGFNPGSVLEYVNNTDLMMAVAVTTTLAATAGGISALFTWWILRKKADFGAALNGILGGLVAITANADWVTNGEAFIIGVVGGIVVVAVMILLERLKIDDAVGAVPVHGGAGVWAGIATAIFGTDANWTAQIVGTVIYPVWAFAFAFIIFSALKAIKYLRVSPEDEETGLDRSEHGNTAYVITSLNPSAGD